MSDNQFQPFDDNNRTGQSGGSAVRLASWIVQFILFWIVTPIIWAMMFRRSAIGSSAAMGMSWVVAMIVAWTVMAFARRGIRRYLSANSNSRRKVRREQRYTYADADDLFETTVYEKPKRVAQLGDDGEMVYVDETRQREDKL